MSHQVEVSSSSSLYARPCPKYLYTRGKARCFTADVVFQDLVCFKLSCYVISSELKGWGCLILNRCYGFRSSGLSEMYRMFTFCSIVLSNRCSLVNCLTFKDSIPHFTSCERILKIAAGVQPITHVTF